MSDALADIAAALERAGVAYALIGGHAVNAWLEPRFTADIDVTMQAGPGDLARVSDALAGLGLTLATTHAADLPSGPDFVRYASADGGMLLEVQLAKTDFQRDVIARAARGSGPRVATPEDLIVLKLIADRPKDQIDLRGLRDLPALDWAYVERCAAEWGVADRLQRLRTRSS